MAHIVIYESNNRKNVMYRKYHFKNFKISIKTQQSLEDTFSLS